LAFRRIKKFSFSSVCLRRSLNKFVGCLVPGRGADDQVVPLDDSGRLSVKLVKNGTLKVYPGYPHGMLTIHTDVINPDLLAFIRA
jgi:non-heme chloroperoxidase